MLLRLYTNVHTKRGTSVECCQDQSSCIPTAQVPKLPVLLLCDEMAVFSQSFFYFFSPSRSEIPCGSAALKNFCKMTVSGVCCCTWLNFLFLFCCSLHYAAAASHMSRSELDIWVQHRKNFILQSHSSSRLGKSDVIQQYCIWLVDYARRRYRTAAKHNQQGVVSGGLMRDITIKFHVTYMGYIG